LASEGLALFAQLGETYGLVGSLVTLGSIAFGAGQAERAARLLGAADQLCSAIGAALLPPWRIEFETTTEATRAAMGAAAFEAARETGRAMPLRDAIIFAGDASLSSVAVSEELGGLLESSDRPPLTQREWDVVRLLADGLSNRQIGAELVIAEGTAALHVKHVLHKLGFESRAQVAAWAARQLVGSTLGSSSPRSPD